MNIAFWILVILAAGVVWIAAVRSLAAARMGKNVYDVYRDVKKNMEIERDKDDEHW